jgi:hypothetical protein
MTVATNAFTTYSQIGIKENVSNLITNITPDETPAYSTFKKFSVKNRLYEWQTDALATPGDNNKPEGDVAVMQTSVATTMLNNRTQIGYKSMSVSDTAQAVATYGRGNEYDYQVTKKGRELKTDIEIGLLKNSAKAVGGDGGTNRISAGLPTWITNLARGTAPTGTGVDTVDTGTALVTTALTYAMCATAMTMAFSAGGAPSILMLPPILKRSFSGLAFSSTPSTADVRYNLSSGKPAVAVGTVEQWLSDFGTVNVVVNRQMARVTGSGIGGATGTQNMLNNAAFFVDPSKVRVGILQDTEVIPLSKRGLADEAMIRAEWTLEVSSPTAHAAIYNVT